MNVKALYLLKNKKLNYILHIKNSIVINTTDLYLVSQELQVSNYHLIAGTVIDNPKHENRFLLTYIFSKFHTAEHIYVNGKYTLTALSIAKFFSSGIWIEREIYDMFGLHFSNKESEGDLRRILTDYHFRGHPLRKDFSLIGYNEKIYSHLSKSIHERSKFFF